MMAYNAAQTVQKYGRISKLKMAAVRHL